MGKRSNPFNQLLMYEKIQVSWNNLLVYNWNNLLVYNIRFLIWLFRLLSITLPRVLTATILFLQCYSCAVILLGLFSKRSSQILHSSHQERSIKNRLVWSHKNTIVSTFPHIRYLHLMYCEVAWVLVSSWTQVQLQIILIRD